MSLGAPARVDTRTRALLATLGPPIQSTAVISQSSPRQRWHGEASDPLCYYFLVEEIELRALSSSLLAWCLSIERLMQSLNVVVMDEQYKNPMNALPVS